MLFISLRLRKKRKIMTSITLKRKTNKMSEIFRYRKKSILILSVLFIIMLQVSCEKPQEYSDIPEVTFKSLSVKKGLDTLGNEVFKFNLIFDFVDGDGNLGLSPYDTLGDFAPGKPYYYNLHIDLYQKQDGVFTKDEDVANNFRFQNISKTGTNNKLLKGEMNIDFELSKYPNKDTCCFKFYIFDRLLNQSNIEKTNEIYPY